MQIIKLKKFEIEHISYLHKKYFIVVVLQTIYMYYLIVNNYIKI